MSISNIFNRLKTLLVGEVRQTPELPDHPKSEEAVKLHQTTVTPDTVGDEVAPKTPIAPQSSELSRKDSHQASSHDIDKGTLSQKSASNDTTPNFLKSEAAELQPSDTMLNSSPLNKRAIVIIAYNNFEYFSKVFNSVLIQTVKGKSFDQLYDLYVFQDGLQNRHLETQDAYNSIKKLALEHLPSDKFIRQDKNIGTGLHFAWIESFIFKERNYDFSFFLEHDFELGGCYLQAMELLHNQFKDDPRIACFSGHSRYYKQSTADQLQRSSDYALMTHDWGAGVFRRTWQKRLPAMESYYKLIEGAPFEQRNHLLIQEWMSFMGFIKGSTSQDTIKASVDTGLGLLRLTTHVNLGTYIGRDGMHWNSKIYEDQGYHETVVFDGNLVEMKNLSDELFASLLSQQKQNYLASPLDFSVESFALRLSERKTDIDFNKNLTSAQATEDDIVAAYKFFLGRMPESREVIQARVGLDMKRVLTDFLLSSEFLNREEVWPIVGECSRRIVALYKARYPTLPTSTQAQSDSK